MLWCCVGPRLVSIAHMLWCCVGPRLVSIAYMLWCCVGPRLVSIVCEALPIVRATARVLLHACLWLNLVPAANKPIF